MYISYLLEVDIKDVLGVYLAISMLLVVAPSAAYLGLRCLGVLPFISALYLLFLVKGVVPVCRVLLVIYASSCGALTGFLVLLFILSPRELGVG
jgi:hypothetical protein